MSNSQVATQLTMRSYLKLAVILVPFAWYSHAFAQNSQAVESQNPTASNIFEFSGGYRQDVSDGDESTGFFNLSYKGQMLKQEGTPFKYASGLDLAAPTISEGSGDRQSLVLRYEEGTISGDEGLLHAETVFPLLLRGTEKLNLRGMGLLAGNIENSTYQIAVGLETSPFRIPGFSGSQASNWIVFGINGQRQEASDTEAEDKNFALLTHRTFLGKAFGWRKSANTGETAARLNDQILQEATSYKEAQVVASEIKASTAANNRSELQQLFLNAVDEVEDPSKWKEIVKELSYGHADAITDQPTLAIYAENSGWYNINSPVEGAHRFNNLLTLSMDYWFLPERDDVFLRIRYENGFERAAPLDHKNHLLISTNLRF